MRFQSGGVFRSVSPMLQTANVGTMRTGIGLLLRAYSSFHLFGRKLSMLVLAGHESDMADVAAGLLGGATSLNGVLTALWAWLRGWSKIEQRAMTQPFVLITHVLTLSWLGDVGGMDMRPGQDVRYCLPALVTGG